MNTKALMMPAIAYSIHISLKSVRGFRESPQNNEERDDKRNIQEIEHSYLRIDLLLESGSSARMRSESEGEDEATVRPDFIERSGFSRELGSRASQGCR